MPRPAPLLVRRVFARTRDSAALRYGIAVGVAVLSVVPSALIQPAGRQTPYYFIATAAVAVGALCGGRAPGLLGALLSTVLLDWFFYAPARSFALVPPDVPLTVAWTAVALLAVWGGAALRDTYEHLERERGAATEAAGGERAARERAEQSEALLDAVLEQMPAGAAIADASGRMLRTNRRVAEMWRYAPAAAPLPVEAYAGFHADGRPYAAGEWPLARALHGERIEEEEIGFRRGDGSRGTMLAGAAPVRDRDGRIVAAVANSVDITARNRDQRALETLAEASRVLSESLDVDVTLAAVARLAVPALADWCAVVLLERGGARRVAVEAASPERRALARRVLEAYEVSPTAADGLGRVLRSGESVLVPEVTEAFLDDAAPDAEGRAMLDEMGLRSYVAVPLRARGEILGAVCLATAESGRRLDERDRSLAEDLARRCAVAVENARLYAAAQAAVRQREDVLAVVSHDLRNLLSTVVMSASMLDRSLPGDADAPGPKRRARMIHQAADRMHRLIRDLADLASIDAGRLAMERRLHDPAAILEEAVETFRAMAHDRGVRLACRLPRALPVVECDRDRVLQVFGNLLSNALQATERGGAVTVSARAGRGGWVLFSVEDTGRGIPREELPRVFERWRRGRSAEYTGSGLGLAISRALVEAHGGRIWARSSPGVGTTFRFLMPAAPAARVVVPPRACGEEALPDASAQG